MHKTIIDPDTDLGSFSPVGGVPSGFANTSGTHLETTYSYDNLGRVIKIVGPEHTAIVSGTPKTVRGVQWYVFNDGAYDTDSEVRTASGYLASGNYTVVGGVSIGKRDRAGRTIESIVSERDPGASGEFSGSEDYAGRSRWRSWSRSLYNDAGDMTERWVYHDIPISGDGSEGTNYAKTQYEYDDLGRVVKTIDPAGKARWTFYKAKLIDGAYGQEVRVYPHVYNDGGYKLAGPISVSWTDAHGRHVRSFLANATISGNEPTGDEALTPHTRSTTHYDWRGRVTKTRRYFNIDTLTENDAGTKDTHYYESENLAYDNAGRLLRSKDPSGDISAVVYDALGRVVTTWAGTDDTGATRTDPGASGSNLNIVARHFYDDDGDGTGNPTIHLTRAEQLKPNLTGSLTGVASEFTGVDLEYDTFGRHTWAKPDVGPWSRTVYNEIGQTIERHTYRNGSTTHMLAKTATVYEGGDRVAAVRQFKMDGSGGATSNYVETTFGYDSIGRQNLIQTTPGAYTVTEWDHAGRVTSELLYADSNTVVEESVLDYNVAGNVIQQTHYARMHNAGSYSGKLSADPTKARRNYNVMWYDHAHRSTHNAFFGTNGDAVLTDYDPGTSGTQSYDEGPPEPDTSDNVIVTRTDYDELGRVDRVTDNAGIVTKFFYRDDGVRTHVVENYLAGGTYWASEPGSPKARASDQNRVTESIHTPWGRLEKLVAIDPDADGDTSDNQETHYIYSSALTDKGVPNGGVISNNRLIATIMPDSDDVVVGNVLVDGSDSTYDRIQMSYYSDGTLRTREDQRGTVITFAYYDDGALKAQTVTTLEGNTDGYVRAMTYTYDDLRRAEKLTSHGNVTDDPTNTINIRNQIQLAYNGMNQLETEYQEHSGAVNAGTSMNVAYGYTESVTENAFTRNHRFRACLTNRHRV